MRRILVDAGPLIALFDRNDAEHRRVLDFLAGYRGRIATSWAVVTEILHVLDFSTDAQLDFIEWLQREALEIPPFPQAHLARVQELTRKYADLPMDFAEATLVVLAENEGIGEILTLDSDFRVYRMAGGGILRDVLAAQE